jgi:hypothetical protein
MAPPLPFDAMRVGSFPLETTVRPTSTGTGARAEGCAAMESFVLGLMVWISSVSGLPLPEDVPEIRRIDPARMATLAVGPGAADPEAESGYLALYHADSRTVLLRHDWDMRDLRDRSILVHELVHHLQAEAGRDYLCKGEMEREAYEIQAVWLEARGAELFEVMNMNGLFLFAVTRC